MFKLVLSHLMLFLVFSSCSHREELKERHIIAGSCENEFNKVELSPGETIWENVSQASSTGASYLITGLGYSTDFIVSFTGGVIGGVTICSPVVALEMLASPTSSSGGQVSGECIGRMGVAAAETLNPNLGKKAEFSTSKWRCPNLDSVVKGLFLVADCYSKRGDSKSTKEQLERMNSSAIFNRCMNKKMKTKISDALKEIK